MRKLLTSTAAAACLALHSQAFAGDDTARYEIRFNSNWTVANHPLAYPDNAHHSGLIGATHNAKYSIFEDGSTPTAGLEALSEKGAHSPLDAEIRKAIEKGGAGALFESGPQFMLPGSLKAEFTADAQHPYVSAVAMIAPSPDWFTGVANVELMRDGTWANEMTVTLWAWDAGTDSGTTYKAPDADTKPRQSVRLNASEHFRMASEVKPIGTAVIRRLDMPTN
jgi:hypothetical protein